MGFATHLGPWLLGTVKDTTGTTAGTIRNTGCTLVEQFATLSYTDTAVKNIAVVPAGAAIHVFLCDVTVAFNAGTNNVITIQTAGGQSLATVTGTGAPIAVGRNAMAVTAGGIATYVNVGTTDVIIQALFAGTGTAATTGTAYITTAYAVRDVDGSAAPANA
jgi:hypothetical protein